mmetsp:Transcript_6683/g.14005  ORF Transcript_6683/g.14005 Transcript_6683/m.14005 type:complete len:319 (+) Transcript_6683:212-1168(+)
MAKHKNSRQSTITDYFLFKIFPPKKQASTILPSPCFAFLFLPPLLLPGQVRILRHPELRRRDLQYLVGRQVLDAGVEGHLDGGRDARGDALVGRSHVGELLGLADVDLEVAGALVDADDHALVHVLPRLHHQLPPILRALQSEGCDRSVRKGQKRSLVPSLNVALNLGSVGIKDGIENRGASGGGEGRRSQAQHAAGGDQVLDDRHALPLVEAHVLQFALALIEQIHDPSHEFLRHANLDGLPRFLHLSRLLVHDVNDAGRAHLQFEPLAPHGFDEDRQVKLTASRHHVLVGRVGLGNLKSDVAIEFLEQTFAYHAGG